MLHVRFVGELLAQTPAMDLSRASALHLGIGGPGAHVPQLAPKPCLMPTISVRLARSAESAGMRAHPLPYARKGRKRRSSPFPRPAERKIELRTTARPQEGGATGGGVRACSKKEQLEPMCAEIRRAKKIDHRFYQMCWGDILRRSEHGHRRTAGTGKAATGKVA